MSAGTPASPERRQAAEAAAESRVRPRSRALHLCYGGTFDPIHRGHLAIAQAAYATFKVPVHLLPAADPPHRAPPGADAAHRARMVELAIATHPGLRLDLRELVRARDGAPSYTIDTLRALRAELGADAPLAWLLGADSLASLMTWHRWDELLGLAHLVVADRGDADGVSATLAPALRRYLAPHWNASAEALAARPYGLVHRLHQPLRTESASAVRPPLDHGQDARALLPAAVADYIRAHALYQ